MTKIENLISEIKEGVNQCIASQKDEVRVMQAMLNDKEYAVGVYSKEGKVGEYCPSEDARAMLTSVMSTAAKISKQEASALADAHEFTKAEAETFVNVSKQFVLTYCETGRKLPLGKREGTNFSLFTEVKPEKYSTYPKKVGVDENGNDIYNNVKKDNPTPEHVVLRTSSPCPEWLKSEK